MGQGQGTETAEQRTAAERRVRQDSELFGSYGKRPRFFGRQGMPPKKETDIDQPAFGRRVQPPKSQISLQKERLRGLYAELWMVFSDPAYPQNGVPIQYQDGETPVIRLGDQAVISVDAQTGAFVFRNEDGTGSSDTITTSDIDRLMDFLVAHLTRMEGTPQGGLAHVEKSVGRSIEDVERVLILSTLRHCQGNRTMTARMLGISLRTLRNKLHAYWASLIAEGQRSPDALT
ncbi:hypothetical protein ASG47_02715 [Devosia sp. Leaf420]|nr:hypothetical protein ASG47_02715 [Devosia sp. Leaf420]